MERAPRRRDEVSGIRGFRGALMTPTVRARFRKSGRFRGVFDSASPARRRGRVLARDREVGPPDRRQLRPGCSGLGPKLPFSSPVWYPRVVPMSTTSVRIHSPIKEKARKADLSEVAGAGFEPATFGL
jgi:hypothetical protein